MGVQGSCHCGNVRIELPSKPEWVADCNCSLCRRLAWRVAYSHRTRYAFQGDDSLCLGRSNDRHSPLSVCGCGTHWQSLGEDFGKMGINARLLDNFDESTVEVRKFDNADN